MPFADYEDFDACTAANSDKEDPEAYCAQIHYNATGEWPGQKSAGDFYDDPDLYAKHAAEAMEEMGIEPTDEKLTEVWGTTRELI